MIVGVVDVHFKGEVKMYAWRDDAVPNLMNKSGLPASSFRTDKWKGVTEGKH